MKNLFNMDQYDLGLVLAPNIVIFLLPLISIYFLNWQLMNVIDSERNETFQKIDYFYYF